MTNIHHLIDEWKKENTFLSEYDSQQDEFDLARILIAARQSAGLTQEEVASRMSTSRPTVARLESGKQNTSLRTIHRYANAVGAKVKLELLPH
jgi:DNA-binding XRE family transcriptional regulator